jgi:hypothetical protein
MTTVALDAFPQYLTNGGLPLAGGKLYSYQAGTSTPLATYTDRSGSVANANPVVLDAAGRADVWLSVNVAYKLVLEDSAGNVLDSVDDYYAGADPAQLTAAGIVPSTGGTYTGLVSFTGGATFDGTTAQDLATLNSLGIQSVHNNNLFENSSFSAFPNGAGTYADGAVGFPKTSVLCDGGSVTLAQVAQPENGVPYAMRITQPDAGPKRIGFVQQVTAANTFVYRGQSLVLVPRLRCSAATTLRVALVAFTGTADTAPADVVNNWASTTYTAGNFFIANTTTIAVTATAVGAATFTDCLVSSASPGGVVGPNTMNNLYMVVWTDLAQAQNVTLDAANVRCGAGTEAPVWYPNDPSSIGRLLNIQTFTSSGTYTPTPGTTRIVVEGQGSAGAGGGSVATAAGQVSVGGGGGSGGRSKTLLTAGFYPTVTVTIGAGGAGASGANGGSGGNSTFGTFMTCNGGAGGGASGSAAVAGVAGGAGGSAVGGTIFNSTGAAGGAGLAAFAGAIAVSGAGGDSGFGSGAIPSGVAVNGGAAAANGVNSSSIGSGGSGGVGGAGGGATSGGAGSAGAFIVYEYA